eukprot:1161623-Pelagomonas_calceolata.AAC.19
MDEFQRRAILYVAGYALSRLSLLSLLSPQSGPQLHLRPIFTLKEWSCDLRSLSEIMLISWKGKFVVLEHISCEERPPVDVCNEKASLLDTSFVLVIIISLTKVTVWGRPVIPSCCLIAKGVNTESKSSHAANDITGEVKEHVFGETVGRMHNQGPVCRGSAPLVIGQMPGPEIHNKTIEMNGLTIQQLLFENVGVCQSMADRIWVTGGLLEALGSKA